MSSFFASVFCPVAWHLFQSAHFFFGVQTGSSSSADGVFCGYFTNRPGFLFFSLDLAIIRTLHVIISAILVVVLCMAIVYHQRRKRQLIIKKQNEVSGVKVFKEYSAIIIMILISCINISVFIPGFVQLAVKSLVDISTWSQSSQNTFANFSRFTQDFICVTHSVNFLVYLFIIPTFRSAIGNVFTCCLAK